MKQTSNEADTSKSKKTILVIEDEQTLLKALTAKLQREKFKVVSAIDGETGLKVAKQEHPDLILLDIIMPKMDGLTVLKLLRQDQWGAEVPVIILSNLSDERKVAEAIVQNTYDYLVKTDWSLNDVVAKIRERLNKVRKICKVFKPGSG